MTSYLVTGATGSFGRAFVRELLTRNLADRVAVYSRSEFLQSEMAAEFGHDKRLRFFLGDVRDLPRLTLAMRGVHIVVHAAALKQVPALEYNPTEAIKTNVLGAMNVIDAALANGVRRVLALSTDKAAQPVNLYGATKLCAEKLFVAANAYSGGESGPVFSCVRYGNVAGSRGSVIPLWRRLADDGRPLPITDIRMTRYWMRLDQAVGFVLRSLARMRGGEVLIPKLSSFKVQQLAMAVWLEAGHTSFIPHGPTESFPMVGLRPGEKLHESLIGIEEAHNAYDLGEDYCLATPIADEPRPRISAMSPRVPDGFSYTSENNGSWLTVEGLREQLAIIDGKVLEVAA